jgi:hypothetical protein
VKAGAFIPNKTELTETELMRQLAESKVVALIAYMQKVGSYEAVDHERKPSALDPDTIRDAGTKAAPATTSNK